MTAYRNLAPWVICCSLLCPLRGQEETGAIRLTVVDSTGIGMQATGTLRGALSAITRAFTTDSQGKYTISGLPFSSYRVEVTRRGFQPRTTVIEVISPDTIALTLPMELDRTSTRVEVLATTPLPGSNLSVDDIPAPVQVGDARELAASGALDVADFLNRRLSGININENQGNPFQPDLNYRGYTASPLLGTPQGISIYLDGVRQNQPFGDVVSWDLIPRVAIAEAALIPGSNPLFGLNTLGGAVAIETKDGRSSPGIALEASGGSYGRRSVEAQYGASRGNFHWYAAGNLFHEDGWRAASPSSVRQTFTKLGWTGPKTLISVSGGYADNSLAGNGLQEQRLLARHYASAYTTGDVTENRSPFVTLGVRHAITSALSISATAYFRYVRADSTNPNLNRDSLDQSVYQPTAADQAALRAAGYSGFPASGATAANTPFPSWRCIAQALLKDEPSEKCNGLLVRGSARQNNYGVSGQLTWLSTLAGHPNQFTAGGGWDAASLSFTQNSQYGFINPDYSLTPVDAFQDGSTNTNGVPVDTRVRLHGRPRTASVYAADTVSPSSAWTITASARYNRTLVENSDRLKPGAGPGSLDGAYSFQRINPALGVVFKPYRAAVLYASYSESSRAPTSIELGCADPLNPCNLPNALAGDPALKQVYTRTVEAGLRGSFESGVHWRAGWFRGSNFDDLLFVSSSQTGNGYFKNFGQTRRQGAETQLDGRIRRLTLGGNYTFVQATYESAETLNGSSNSSSDAAAAGLPGNIHIVSGNQIPQSPRHLAKIFADWDVTKRLSLDLDFLATSRSFARGNENNLSRPDGIHYLGPGTSPGYGLLNLAGRYQIRKGLEVFAQVNNALNHRYYTAAQLGPAGFDARGHFLARPLPAVNGDYPLVNSTFYAPGAPLGAWGGLRFRF